ncbi:N-6 DNA methylase [Deinococcus sp. VB142]|uniref:site-specific DNA-methyltransferase (adenine-specific) n=1 Tax=Deinococcus sp. VB142 TaxID=3112952 RepID=A0AAU6Q3Y3_9DEIO
MLGYERTGVDIRRKANKGRVGIPDALLLGGDDSVQVVVEVKRPTETLSDHEDQLRRYMLELRAGYGILTHGLGFRLYQRHAQSIDLICAKPVTDLTQSDLAPLFKRSLDPFDRQQVQARVEESRSEGLSLRRADDLASEQFLMSLGLEQGSPFANLVRALTHLLTELENKSPFVNGSYDFWKKLYAREPDPDHIPALWRKSDALLGTGKEDLYHFSFALETAYSLTARLILAKVIQDHSRNEAVTGRNLAELLLDELKRQALPRTPNKLPPRAYPQAVRELFDQYAQTLFTSVYATDIFDWWRDYEQADEAQAHAFADALARLLLSLLRFDFSALEGDLLGELYQRYFDPETRKALGEFYTPPAVVDFMLDEAEYHGERDKKLLDPATGSGTFIVTALRRYLKANAHRDPAEVLRNLTEDYALVAFDINPFAVLMAQVNFAALLVPLYAKVVKTDPDFVLRRLPIVRTDSLRQEGVEGQQQAQGSQKGVALLGLDFGDEELTAQIELPIRVGKQTGLTVELTFPNLHTAMNAGVVDNEREWLRALQAVFAAVEERSQAYDRGKREAALPELALSIRRFLARSRMPETRLKQQTAYLEPYAAKVWDTLQVLKDKHGDGRFLKTLEDLMLGLVLKSYLKYDVVVGNPPYVRIQKLPELLRRYWERYYQWADGNFDIYIPFVERALLGREGDPAHGWLSEGGRLVYIIPNRFRNAEYATLLRRYLPRFGRLRSLLDMGAATFTPQNDTKAARLFREAMVYPAILSVEKRSALPTEEPPFPAVRLVPRPLDIDPAAALNQIAAAYADLRGGKPHDLGTLGDAVAVEAPIVPPSLRDDYGTGRSDWTPAGWYIMTEAEREVFETLDNIGKEVDPELQAAGKMFPYRRLQGYTATVSGGFAGVQTSLDSVMVLQQVEGTPTDGPLLTLRPKGGGDPVTLERAALRPFLFGRDVERWHIDWQGWWVIFPYLDTVGGFELMPTARYREHMVRGKGKDKEKPAFARYPQDGPNLETAYPHLWAYLTTHEKALRGRENGKYKVGKADEWRWYDHAYPRSLNAATNSKVILQVTSKGTKMTSDSNSHLFAGGGTSGVYGISLQRESLFYTTILNSLLADFFIRTKSMAFSGGYYSYGDQFIKDVPIPHTTPEQRRGLAELAGLLTERTGELRRLQGQVLQFPDSASEHLRGAGRLPSREALSEVATLRNLPKEVRFSALADAEAGLFSGDTVELRLGQGKMQLSAAHAGLVREILRVRGKVARDDFEALRIPNRPADVRLYTDLLAEWERRIEELGRQIEDLEKMLNAAVYDLYGLSAEQQATVEAFLARY